MQNRLPDDGLPEMPTRSARAVRNGEAEASRSSADRSMLDRSESGAPAAGHAVRDLFSTDEIFQRLVATADEEFVRSNRLLFWSGVAAGLSIGLSFVARAAVTAAGPEPLGAVLGTIAYPIGFLLIVLGRYQLFTENTLTPVTLVLTRIASVPLLLRVWGMVLMGNLVGAALMAMVLAYTGVLDPDTAVVARSFGRHGLEVPPSTIFWKGVIAGWLVASMVWLNHAARETITRFLIVYAVMSLVPAADLFHCIIGACEMMYLVFLGEAAVGHATFGFFLPVLLGNTVGGVLLVGILNYAQTRGRHFPGRDARHLGLTWRQWLFGMEAGRSAVPEDAPGPGIDPQADETGTGSLLDKAVPEEEKEKE